MNLTFFDIVRIFCLSRNVKKSKITSKLCKKSRNKRRSNHFFNMFSETSPRILLPFRIVALHESGIRKAISWSVEVYNKTVSSQCNLISQIEQVQDKYHHPTINIEKGVSSNRKDIGRQHGCSPLFLYLSYWDSCLSYDHTTCLHVLSSLW